MRKHNLIKLLMLLSLFSYVACSSPEIIPGNGNDPNNPSKEGPNKPNKPNTTEYNNKNSGKGAEALINLLSRVDTEKLIIGDAIITDAEYQEIKQFTDNLMAEKKAKDNATKIKEILYWVKGNIKYKHGDLPPELVGKYFDINYPYPTFKEKLAVCQGYSALLKVMAHTQGIPAFVINGNFIQQNFHPAGHAWNCAYVGNTWILLDPTNSTETKTLHINGLGPNGFKFEPHHILTTVAEDENFEYSLREGYLSVVAVKSTNETVEIPEYFKGLSVDGLYLSKQLPASVKNLKLSKFIKTIGLQANAMRTYANGLESVEISKDNRTLDTYKGIIYEKDKGVPLYIPSRMKAIHLRPSTKVEKNIVENHEYVEELWFGKGTKEIDSFAVENCKNLKKIYVPKGATYSKQDSFVKCHKDLEIIEYDPSK